MPVTKPEMLCDITCPFCGLACDDLQIESSQGNLTPSSVECAISHSGFRNASTDTARPAPSAKIGGKDCSTDEAIEQASTILRAASMPLFAGLATDVKGARSTLNLADRCGAVVDHMNSSAMFRNIRIAQDSGWVASTLSDVRNHADLMIIFGEKLFDLFPRFAERVVFPPSRMYSSEPAREIILVGLFDESTLPEQLRQVNPLIIPVTMQDMSAFSAVLRARVSGNSVHQSDTVDLQTIDILSSKLENAHYSSVVWAASEQDYPHAELTIQNLTELVKALNKETRSTVLPLGGSQGDMTFNQVCTWQTGYPVRTSFSSGQPHYDPLLYDHQRMLSNNEADALLWISCLTPDRAPPDTEIPTVVIGHPRMEFTRTPEVFLPAGIPGIDHSGHMYRTDAVTTLPLRKLREPVLPSASSLLDKIAERQ